MTKWQKYTIGSVVVFEGCISCGMGNTYVQTGTQYHQPIPKIVTRKQTNKTKILIFVKLQFPKIYL